MAITKTVHKWERVVPVRFARAPHDTDPTISSGTYDQNAPEPDDRGFLPHSTGGGILPIGLDEAVRRAARPESRVRLIRMDMENTGQLFVTSTNRSVFRVMLPAANAALPATKEMMIKLRAVSSGSAHLKVHFGSISGPVIHQIKVVVNPLIDVKVVAHLPTISGVVPVDSVTGLVVNDPVTGAPFPAQSNRSDQSVRDLIAGANQIFFPYGIRLIVDSIDRVAPINLTNQGMLDDLNEFNTMTALNRVRRRINAYFVPQIANPSGVGNNHTAINRVAGVANSAKNNPRTYGLFIADWATTFQTIAHEVGHLFNVINDPTRSFDAHANTTPDPALGGTGRVNRFDTITRRRLMWAFTGIRLGNSSNEPNRALHNLPFRDDVGYGRNAVGGMLTIKQLNNDRSDLELAEVRGVAKRLP